jgi:hypothetical protein
MYTDPKKMTQRFAENMAATSPATAQFRNKAEAQQAIQDMERREAVNSHRGSKVCDERAAQYRAEAARIRALLPTLPD